MGKTMTKDDVYNVRYILVDDIDECYNILVESEKEFDEYLDMFVIPENTLSKEQFLEILAQNNKRIRCLVLEEWIPFQEKHSKNTELIKIITGFAVFELVENFKVTELHVQDNLTIRFRKLIDGLIEKSKKSQDFKKITIEIPEKKENLLRVFADYKPKTKLIHKNGKDLYFTEILTQEKEI